MEDEVPGEGEKGNPASTEVCKDKERKRRIHERVFGF